MFGWAREILNRLSREPRYVDEQRVPPTVRTLAGVSVTPDTAITIATVWACLRYLSQTVAVLPWHVMKATDAGSEIQIKHPIDWLLHKRPNEEWSSFQFRETLTHWALRWGNGYAEIERDALGRPFALWPIHPERVDVCRDKDSGRLFYEVDNGLGGRVQIDPADMFHIRGFGEGPVGVNVIAYAAQSLGWARAAQLFGAAFFGNGANVSGVVMNKVGLSPDGLKRQRAEFEHLYKGIRNAHKTAHLDNEAKWERIGLNAEETQLIEVHQHLIEEVCRWFGVPPHKVAHLLRATFSNIEHQAIEVVVDSVSPWVKRFEDEADFKLFGQNRQGLYTKMNMRALLRGDFKSQQEGFQIARQNGAMNVNEWREYLDLNGIGDDGNKYVMQAQYTTLDKIGAELESTQEDEPEIVEDDAAVEARRDFDRLMEPVHVE